MWKKILNLAQVLPLALAAACASTSLDPFNGNGDGGIGGGGDKDGGTGKPGCVGRQCQVNYSCPAGSKTTLTGRVTIPAGTLPLYNANVYIPSAEVAPPPSSGPSCDRCEQIVPLDVAAKTTTDVDGTFTLTDVPSGKDIPLVIRVGKWRRVITIPSIADCTSTAIDTAMTRLPRNRSEGNIPKIALSTGSQDALECLLRSNKLGLDDSEFTQPAADGRVNLYAGGQRFNGTAGTDAFDQSLNGGAPFPSSNPWWNDVNNWNQYDIVLLSCEGAQNAGFKSPAAHAALESFVNNGGRVFASHWHNIWVSDAKPPLSTVATFVDSTAGGYINDTTPIIADINQSFPKGKALANWLQLPAVGGSTQLGKLMINYSRVTLTGRSTTLTQDWADYSDAGNLTPPLVNPASQYFSFNTPIGVPAQNQCGQMVFTDIHVSGGKNDVSTPSKPFPTGCTSNGLTPQEKALIFLLFDLTNCLQTVIG
ncbi:MAG TPA: carboxypeptidase regulatory-like domain-containing protein [Pseudomonadota bacterium]|nr:carboxypeptidase regulatory-like domain-containing protein [Pseudomonadota bacterium]